MPLGAAASGARSGLFIDNWWMFALRGALAIIFGVLAMVHPLAALMAIVVLFGVWAFVDGITALGLAFSGPERTWQLVVIGLLGIGAGIVTFFWPGLTAVGLYAAVAGWSIAHGIVEIALAIKLRKVIAGEIWLILAGIVSIAFGVLLIALPMAGLLAVAWMIGLYAIIFGVVMCALSARLYRIKTPTTRPVSTVPPVPT
jgi:uncharacterized membrane protein HdeD (DUF308 family)